MEVVDSGTVNFKPYSTSASDCNAIVWIVHGWKMTGIISDSMSLYASPVLLVNKASGEKQLCVDYHKLSQKTITQHFLKPDVDSELSTLAEGVIFTLVYLSNSFLQIPFSEEQKKKPYSLQRKQLQNLKKIPFYIKSSFWNTPKGNEFDVP